MRSPAAGLLAAVLAAQTWAADGRLRAVSDPEPGSWRGLALSQGPGRPVCARATFDRRKASGGGFILVVDSGEPGDEDAVRMSEAVVARRGGLTSRAALSARRHGIAAVALGRGVWDPTGPSLTLTETSFGPVEVLGGAAVRVAVGARERVLGEGDAVCVDPSAARILLPEAEESSTRVAAAEAARAYDGLRDAGALERWLAAESGPGRAASLAREIIPRALEGEMPSVDFARLVRAMRAAAGEAGRERLSLVEGRVFLRARRALGEELAACRAAVGDAASVEILDGLVLRAGDSAARAQEVGRILGQDAGGASAAARDCALEAARRRRLAPAASASLETAARAAGADVPESSALPEDSWRRFAEENGLSEFLAETINDASLGLRRKSARVRERVLAGRLDPSRAAGRAALAAADGPVLVIGPDAALKAGPADVLAKVREVWAASWAPGPLGARLRAGRGAEFEGFVRVERVAKADFSGLAFSRDPGSGRRGRILLEAAPGGIEAVLEGGAAAARRALDPDTARVLESEGSLPSLTTARLKRLARLVRALDSWRGSGVEVAFSFAGEKLLIHHARTLDVPPMPRPVLSPISPESQPRSLPVKIVR